MSRIEEPHDVAIEHENEEDTQHEHDHGNQYDNFEDEGFTIDCGRDWNADDEEYFDDDGEEVPIDDEADVCCNRTQHVQEDIPTETTQCGRQWIIPEALLETSLPLNRLGADLSVNTSDTLLLGTIFDSKDSMILTLGLYHLHNRVEYRAERSSKTRFGAHCRYKDKCQFLMRASANGEQWRVFKWNAPHT